MIQTYGEACKLLPETLRNDYGLGPSAAIKQLKWWLIEESQGFDCQRFPEDIGSLEPKDKSNLRFNSADIDTNFSTLLERT
jgi:hypothetical protein